jgi:hypothetical protein
MGSPQTGGLRWLTYTKTTGRGMTPRSKVNQFLDVNS